MKASDINQGRRLARLIDQLNRSGVEVTICPTTGDGTECLTLIGSSLEDFKWFSEQSVIGCFLDALKSRGLTEETPPDDGID